MTRLAVLPLVLVFAFSVLAQDIGAPKITQGSLFAYGKGGAERGDCPLKNTSVATEISGFIARVRVRQEFENTFSEAIEAVYTFPLSHTGAVDDMTMTVGSRTIKAKIMRREDARTAYEAAKTEGKTASLLDQQRPNIFTQAVANIMPGEKLVVEISYVETMKYEDGAYEFVFPMTVGPRYTPGSVKDAAKITPPYAPDRPGHDLSIEVLLNAGVPIEGIQSTTHQIQQVNFSPNAAKISLRTGKTIPNKDFILRYDVTGQKLQDATLAHRSERGGFFSLILQPPDKIGADDRTPKEIVFVLDTSGSMSGFPIEKAKEAMKLSLGGLNPDDTFNFITFSGDTEVLFPEPVPATNSNLGRALEFLETRSGGGGTEMMKAVRAALDASDSQSHLRIVCFMTDGFVGNENEIVSEVQRHPNARVFSFGIGSSVNRSLLDRIAEAGKGEAEYISLSDDGSKAARKFYERIRTPLLTDISIDWSGLPVTDVYPTKLRDLFSSKPVIIHGRYTTAVNGRVRIRGKLAGQEYVRELRVPLPEKEPANSALASLWARTRIDELSAEKLRRENVDNVAAFDRQILDLGLEFRVMTPLTSFVAVEERVANYNGVPTKVEVPVAIPEGVSGDSVFRRLEIIANLQRPPSVTFQSAVSGSGQGTGTGAGSGSPASKVARLSPVPNMSTVIQGRRLSEMPIQSRDALDLVTLVPGTSSTGVIGTSSMSSQPKGSMASEINGRQNGFWVEVSDSAGKRLVRGRVVNVVEPGYPEAAKASRTGGDMELGIEVDPDGTVDAVTVVSGSEVLRKAAVDAAGRTRFARVYESGRPVRMSATLIYRFNPSSGKAEIVLKKVRVVPLTEEDERWIRLSDKLHHLLYDILVREKRGIVEPSETDDLFVVDGMAAVRIELQSSESSVANLLAAGFELSSLEGKIVKGRMPLATLAEFGEIAEVKYVSPLY